MIPYSQQFLEALQRRLPELVSFFQESPDHNSISLHLKAPSGHGDLYVELPVSTCTENDEEILVCFDPWSGNYPKFDYWLREESFAFVVDLIADILSDLVVILVTTKDGKQHSCGPFHLWWSRIRPMDDRYEDHYYMISWTGRGDLLPPRPINPQKMAAP